TGELAFDKMQIDRFRLHLAGDNTLTAPLYDLIFNHALGVAVVPPGKPKAAVYLSPAEALRPVGFEPADGLLPYPDNVFPGYRLVPEVGHPQGYEVYAVESVTVAGGSA